jgi:O-antigen/teichoic acid export membrane protein
MKILIGRLFNNGTFALSDQAIVSLGTFLTNILLARFLGAEEYGIFALLYGLMYFLNSLRANCITYPLTVNASSRNKIEFLKLTSAGAIYTIACTIILMPVLIVGGYLLNSLNVILSVSCFFAVWQLQELYRKSLMAKLKYKKAILGDTITYIGRVIGIVLLYSLDYLTLNNVFYLLTFVTMIGLIIQILQVGFIRISKNDIGGEFNTFWSIGKWMLGSSFVSLLTIQAFPWSLALIYGTSEAGRLQAIINLVGITNPLMIGMWNILLPVIAKTYQNSTYIKTLKVMVKYGLSGCVIILPYFIGVFLFPKEVLEITYGSSVYTDLATVLRIYVLCYLFMYIAQILQSFPSSLKLSKKVFQNQTTAAGISVIFGIPLTVIFGVTGAAIGVLLVNITRTLFLIFIIRNIPRIK